MARPDVLVVLVGSAGGLAAVSAILERLPPELPAPVLVLLHLAAERPSHLPAVLGRRTRLAVSQARDGDVLEPGRVYVAAPDAHLVVRVDGTLGLDDAPPVGHLRPSADVLLASCAVACGAGTLVAVLSGMGRDGAEGAEAVVRAGGIVLAQDEATSERFGMPGAAIATGLVAEVLPLGRIGDALAARAEALAG